MLAFTRFEVVRTLRNGRFLVFLIAMPAVFFLLFGSRDGGGIHERGLSWPTFYLVSMIAYAAIGAAMWAGGPALALERASGWIRQLRTTPLSDRG
jgi:ABC-2 type transport system permease protein